MRTFVVVGHTATTDPEFSLDDLAGGAGRLDVLVRCVTRALLVSHGLRRDTSVYLVLLGSPNAPRTVRFRGDRVRHLNPDERSTAALVRKALALPLAGSMWRESSPGVDVTARGLAGLQEELVGRPVILLDEAGEDVDAVELPPDPVLVLSDHRDLEADESEVLDSWGARSVSLGPTAYHADACVGVVNWVLDRRGAP